MEQHIIFPIPALFFQLALQIRAGIFADCHHHFCRLRFLRADKRRQNVHMVFGNVAAASGFGVEEVVAPTPEKAVAFDMADADAALCAEFGEYCRTPLVGQVERPVVPAFFQAREQLFLFGQLGFQALLFPGAVYGEYFGNFGIIADDVGGFPVNQHIDFAIGKAGL